MRTSPPPFPTGVGTTHAPTRCSAPIRAPADRQPTPVPELCRCARSGAPPAAVATNRRTNHAGGRSTTRPTRLPAHRTTARVAAPLPACVRGLRLLSKPGRARGPGRPNRHRAAAHDHDASAFAVPRPAQVRQTHLPAVMRTRYHRAHPQIAAALRPAATHGQSGLGSVPRVDLDLASTRPYRPRQGNNHQWWATAVRHCPERLICLARV